MSLLEKLRNENSELRKLRYTDYGSKEPLVSKPLPGVDEQPGGGLFPPTGVLSRTTDDVTRVTKFLASRSGVKFITNQAILVQAQNQGKILRNVGTVAKTLSKLVAQTAVVGFGERLESGAIQKYNRQSNYVNTSGPDDQTGTYKPDVKQRLDSSNKEIESRVEKQTPITHPNPYKPSIFTEDNVSSEDKPKSFSKEFDNKLLQTGQDYSFEESKRRGNTTRLNGLDVSYTTVFGLSTLGRSNKSDRLNLTEVTTLELEGEDATVIEPIGFTIHEPGVDSAHIRLRAYVEGFSDNYNGNWNSTSYIGRGEPVYNYTGFTRNVTFRFKIAAHSREELIPLYRKFERLVSTTAPSYSETFMRGVLVEVRIGDYLKSPGFFTNFAVNWDTIFSWDIGYGRPGTNFLKEDKGKILPQILDVQASFTPIHRLLPQASVPGTFLSYV